MRKMLLIVVGGLVVVIALAVVSFVVFFPKRQAVALMEHNIEAATGRDLKLNGAVDITFWPALGVSAEQASLSNPHGFSDTPFFSADKIVFAVSVLPLLTGHIEVKQLILEGAHVQLEAKPDGSANWAFPTQATSQHRASLQDLQLDDVRLSHSQISFQGAEGGAPLALDNVDATLTLASLDQPANLQASFDHSGQHVEVTCLIGKPRAVLEQGETPYSITLNAPVLDVVFQGAFNAANGALNGRLTANGNSLRQLAAWAGSPLGPGSGFGAFHIDAAMNHVGDNTALTDVTAHLDAIDAHGSLTIDAPPHAKLHVGGALTATSLDFNPYLPAPAQGAAASGVQASAGWSSAPINLAGLHALDADLTFASPTLKFQRLTFNDTQLVLKIADGVADAQLAHVGLYRGQGAAHLTVDGSGAFARIGVDLDVHDVDAEPFLTDAIGFDKIQGHGRVVVSLQSLGHSQADIMRALHGTASFDFSDGAFKGVNLLQIAQLISSLQGHQPAANTSSATQFSEMSGSFNVASGSAATNDLHLTSPVVRLDGTGSIDIGAQTINMKLEPHAVNTQHTQTASSVLGVPFEIKGPWAHPSFSASIGSLLQQRLGGLLGQHSTSTSTTSTSTTRSSPQSILNQMLGHH